MKAVYQTDPGKVRSHNEDSVNIVKDSNGEVLLVVADGMGGHKAGEVASSLVVNELSRRFSELSSIGTKEDAVVWLKEIIEEINIKILRYAEEHVDANGLGTTCVCAILSESFLLFGNVGDSSGFVYKKDKLYKVTKDHTLVNMLLESGELTEEEAKILEASVNVVNFSFDQIDEVIDFLTEFQEDGYELINVDSKDGVFVNTIC